MSPCDNNTQGRERASERAWAEQVASERIARACADFRKAAENEKHSHGLDLGNTSKRDASMASMSRKHYESLAEALNGAYPIPENNTPHDAWAHCVQAVAQVLERDNPRFDAARFYDACGIPFRKVTD